ncbi:MAG: adenine nucleotide alpha hydrolase [Kofleriaceae bacterium]|nr:adenine nucleotide alpha hydrolase [Myxococcales bacterium]MCB9572978.1 adenine nucleotide alpha hydrolase [Kofleriaceae bacterium]
MAWSTGKDSAWALHEARRAGDVEIVGLLTTVNATHQRVAMHAVRVEVLRAQAAAVGLPLVIVEIPSPCPGEVYEQAMAAAMATARADGVSHVVFGDLFLEDVRAYREQRLAPVGMTPVFPLWGRDTAALAEEILDAGVEAWITCVDPRRAPAALAGRRVDRALLASLPDGVDPCGEHGETHTFVAAGPMMSSRVPVVPGPVVERDGFVFADLTLA